MFREMQLDSCGTLAEEDDGQLPEQTVDTILSRFDEARVAPPVVSAG